MQEKGTVKSWLDAKGFGFLIRADGKTEIFVHFSEIRNMDGRRSLTAGQSVLFDCSQSERHVGRLQATNVEVIS